MKGSTGLPTYTPTTLSVDAQVREVGRRVERDLRHRMDNAFHAAESALNAGDTVEFHVNAAEFHRLASELERLTGTDVRKGYQS